MGTKMKKIIIGMPKWLIIVVGTVSWSLTMVRSGWFYPYGTGFWGANGHDAIWHLALINSLSRWDFNVPVFAGYALQNYHLGFDLLVAFLHIETGIGINILYFQILPPVFALAIGLLVYRFVANWQHSQKAAWWAVFFVYFGGGMGWLVTAVRDGVFAGESMFWSQAAISTLINPPFALSLIFILLGLIFMQKRKLLLAILFFGVLIEIKVYAGLLVLGGLLVSGFYSYLKHRTNYVLCLFFGSLAISLLVYLPFNKLSAGIFIWQPFWFLETMMGLSDRFGWMKFYSAMTTYRMGGIWFKAIIAYSVAFAVFIVGNMGTRIIFLKSVFKKADAVKVFAVSIIAAGIVIPMFFLQKGTPWNTIQFFYYSLFFSAILTGVVVARMVQNSWFVVSVVLLTVPTTIGAMKHYLPVMPPAMISTLELSALSFLKSQPDGVILTYPYDPIKAKEAEANPPRPLYLYDSTAYVSAFSGKTVFLEDEVNLNITGYDWKSRREEIENWYKEPNQEKAREFLKKNNIKYVYWLKGDKRFLYATEQRAYLGESQLGIEKIFENEEVNLYVVKSEI